MDRRETNANEVVPSFSESDLQRAEKDKSLRNLQHEYEEFTSKPKETRVGTADNELAQGERIRDKYGAYEKMKSTSAGPENDAGTSP